MYVLWTAQNFAVLPGVQYPACVWRPVSSHSSHHPQAVLMAHFSLHVHKGGLKPHSFNFIYYTQQTGAQPILGQRRRRWANIKINIKIDQSTSKSQKFRLWWPNWRYISWFYKSLLQKTFGFNGTLLNWFHSYLNNWYQRVLIHGSMSTKLPVRSGVPQVVRQIGVTIVGLYIEAWNFQHVWTMCLGKFIDMGPIEIMSMWALAAILQNGCQKNTAVA